MNFRITLIITILCLFVFNNTAAIAGDNTAGALCKNIAAAYGVQKFDSVLVLRYTFNVARPTGDTIRRTWEWHPHTGEVTFTGLNARHENMTRTYRRSDVTKDTSHYLQRLDQGFINDQYWLLFPFHLIWDTGVEYTANGAQPLPIPPGNGEDLLVQYGQTGGSTPGDAYEIFVDSAFHIIQWIFHKGGDMQSAFAVTWQHIVHVGPISMAIDHYDADGQKQIWFSDVAVQFNGQNDWKKAD
jgi:hypothetical protein